MRKSLSLALSSLLLASCVLFTPEAASSSASATPATYEQFHAAAVEADNASSGISINERKVVGKVRNLADLYSLLRLQLVPRHTGALADVRDGDIYAKGM